MKMKGLQTRIGFVFVVIGAVLLFLIGRHLPEKDNDTAVVAEKSSRDTTCRSHTGGAHRTETGTGLTIHNQTVQSDPIENSASILESLFPEESSKQEEDDVEFGVLLSEFVESMQVEDIPYFLDSLRSREDHPRLRDLQLQLVRRWAQEDPEDAAAWVSMQPDGEARASYLKGVAIMWAEKDVQAASRWALALKEGEEKYMALKAIAYESVRTDPLHSLELAERLPDGVERNDLIYHAACEWTVLHPQVALEWTLQMENAQLREALLEVVARVWAEQAPFEAATFAVTLIEPGRHQNNAVISILQQWVQRTPAAAAEWVKGFPAGNLRNTAIETIINLWTERSPEDAILWAHSLPNPSDWDAACSVWANKEALHNPAVAMDFAEIINDEALRKLTMNRVAEHQLLRDSAIARGGLENQPLPVNERSNGGG